MINLPHISKKAAGALATTAALALTGYAAGNKINPKQFGLRETFYAVVGDTLLDSRIHMQVPFVQYTHTYDMNTQKINFNAGSCRFVPFCDSTADQNPLTSNITLHYKVVKDHQKITYHRWAMEGFIMPDGYWLLTDMMNTSANAVLGRNTMAHTLSNPQEYLKALHEDLSIRLAQNNIPVEIESLELAALNSSYAPTRTVSYQSIGQSVQVPAPK